MTELAPVSHELLNSGENWTTDSITTSSVRYNRTPVTILLSGEGVLDCRGSFNFMIRRSDIVQHSITQMERDVIKRESLIISRCTCVFAWTKTKIERNTDHVRHCNPLCCWTSK